MEVQFEGLKKDVPVELVRYIINHVVEASRRNFHFNARVVKVLKVHTKAIRHLYHVEDIDKVYRLEIDRKERNQALKTKSNIPIDLKSKMSINERNKVKKYQEKFGYDIPKTFRETLLLDRKNGKTLWSYAIAK